MSIFLGEMIGTMLLILLGNGVVANVLLSETKGNNSGWIVITFGWAIAVFVGVFVAAPISGAHLNPAVTVALASLDKLDWGLVPTYIIAQLLGSIIGSILVWITYKKHFDVTDSPDLIRATFCTSPAIRHSFYNVLTEVIATFALVFGVLYMVAPSSSLGTLDALPVALLVLGIGLGLGGPTGYAINPARDLGPRIAHFLLPISNKSHTDWSYSWIPIVGPLVGGLAASMIFSVLH